MQNPPICEKLSIPGSKPSPSPMIAKMIDTMMRDRARFSCMSVPHTYLEL